MNLKRTLNFLFILLRAISPKLYVIKAKASIKPEILLSSYTTSNVFVLLIRLNMQPIQALQDISNNPF